MNQFTFHFECQQWLNGIYSLSSVVYPPKCDKMRDQGMSGIHDWFCDTPSYYMDIIINSSSDVKAICVYFLHDAYIILPYWNIYRILSSWWMYKLSNWNSNAQNA